MTMMTFNFGFSFHHCDGSVSAIRQFFIPVVCSPSTKYFCALKYRMTIGRDAAVAAAISQLKWVVEEPLNSCRHSYSVLFRWEVVIIRG